VESEKEKGREQWNGRGLRVGKFFNYPLSTIRYPLRKGGL